MTIGMNSLLGDVFGTKTASAHTDEDLTKEANLQFFGELCRAENIDVSQLSDDQAAELFKVAMALKEAADEEEGGEKGEKAGKGEEKGEKAPPFGKKHEAGESKADEKKEEAKKEAAVAEWSEKRAAAVKVAEAEATGRIMAHAMVDELNKIAQAMEGKKAPAAEPTSVEKAASIIDAFNKMKTASGAAPTSATPNFDELAAQQAFEMLKAAEYDPKLSFDRIQAVLTLGLPESEKIASVATPDAALAILAYEFCEAAGFEVDWSKV